MFLVFKIQEISFRNKLIRMKIKTTFRVYLKMFITNFGFIIVKLFNLRFFK